MWPVEWAGDLLQQSVQVGLCGAWVLSGPSGERWVSRLSHDVTGRVRRIGGVECRRALLIRWQPSRRDRGF